MIVKVSGVVTPLPPPLSVTIEMTDRDALNLKFALQLYVRSQLSQFSHGVHVRDGSNDVLDIADETREKLQEALSRNPIITVTNVQPPTKTPTKKP